MCTLGAVAAADRRGTVQSFLLKNCDAWRDARVSHGLMSNGTRYISFSLDDQGGVNAGMNDFGLCIAIAYSDYRSRTPNDSELRGAGAVSYLSLVHEPRTAM